MVSGNGRNCIPHSPRLSSVSVDLILDTGYLWGRPHRFEEDGGYELGLATLNSGGVHTPGDSPKLQIWVWLPSILGASTLCASRLRCIRVWLPSILGASTPRPAESLRGFLVWLPSILGASTPLGRFIERAQGLATLNSGGVHTGLAERQQLLYGLATLNSGGVHT